MRGGETSKLRLEGDNLRQRRSRKLHLFMCVQTPCGAQLSGSDANREASCRYKPGATGM